MSDTPTERPLPRRGGRARFVALGSALRLLKALPGPARERLLDHAVGGVSAAPPPFGDVLRIVGAAGGIPDGTRWQERLLAQRPDLRAVRVHDVVDDADGRLRIRVYRPPVDAPTARVGFVWVHGGAFVLGGLDAQEAHWPAIELAAAGIPVVSADYRMCIDGVHYPQPQDDVLTAWRWARDHADELGVDPDRLHLGGGSAGACLVAGATLRLRDAGLPLPASLYLGYPVLQPHLPPAPPPVAAELATVDLVSDEWVRAMMENWAGSASLEDPYVSPGLADPAGLPPTYVLTCGLDGLRRASEPFVERLRDARVPVRQDVLAGARHAPLNDPSNPHGQEALRRLRTWLTGGLSAMAE